MPSSQVRAVQISDIHLFSDKENSLLGVKTYESISAIVDLLKKDPLSPDVIILSGDLSQDNTEASYLHLVDIFSEFTVPIYYVPGNHDDNVLMTRFLSQGSISNLKNIILNDWQLILLNSQKPNAVEGFLDHVQLSFMEACLQKNPNHHAVILFHHQPVPVGTEWLDRLGLQNAAEFWDILKNYPQVKNVLFGHVHQEFMGHKNGIHLYSTPSSCIQFKPNVVDFALDHIPPGYRWINLKSNGELETGIKRCAKYIGVFDPHAKGY